jgi:release factor glutamine methyltransferase
LDLANGIARSPHVPYARGKGKAPSSGTSIPAGEDEPAPHYAALLEAAGFEGVIIVKDLSDRDRVITNGPDPRTNPIPKM